jgi:hypothetical protein
MGHVVSKPATWFSEDRLFQWPTLSAQSAQCENVRRMVEIASTARPELAHALYMWDTEWAGFPEARSRGAQYSEISKEFVVTCNGSFFRPEVLSYLNLLHGWKPPQEYNDRPLVICPCAADKSYPAPLHKHIRQATPGAYLIVATGVLGLVPESLWPEAPNYDAGIPYNERVYLETISFFQRNPHPRSVVVYSDYLAYWLTLALRAAGQRFVSVFGEAQMPDYLNLSAGKNLGLLKEAYATVSVKRGTRQHHPPAFGRQKALRVGNRQRFRNGKV